MTVSETHVTTMTLAEAFAMVNVTNGEAITVLNSLAESAADRDPEFVKTINDVISKLASPEPVEPPANDPHTLAAVKEPVSHPHTTEHESTHPTRAEHSSKD